MRFTYDNGGGDIQFTIDDDHDDFIDQSRIRKVDYTSLDDNETDAKKGISVVVDIRFLIVNAAEKANIQLFFEASEKVEIDNFDEVQSGSNFVTFLGDMTITRPGKDTNFRRVLPFKDIEFFSMNMQILCDSKVIAVKP